MNWKEIATLRISGLNLNLADSDLICVIKPEFMKIGKLEPINLQFLKLAAWPTARKYQKTNQPKYDKRCTKKKKMNNQK